MEILKSTVGIFGVGAEKTQINEEERKSYRYEVRSGVGSVSGRFKLNLVVVMIKVTGQSVLAHSEAME